MSGWAVYEDQIKTTCSANAGGGIFSLDDYKPWCQYGVPIDSDTVQAIVECCKSGNPCERPVKINGEKHIVTAATEDELEAKNLTKSALSAKLANKCIVIGVGGEGIDTRTLKPGIVKLGDYLKNQGF